MLYTHKTSVCEDCWIFKTDIAYAREGSFEYYTLTLEKLTSVNRLEGTSHQCPFMRLASTFRSFGLVQVYRLSKDNGSLYTRVKSNLGIFQVK